LSGAIEYVFVMSALEFSEPQIIAAADLTVGGITIPRYAVHHRGKCEG
jgi:hypothetical protein